MGLTATDKDLVRPVFIAKLWCVALARFLRKHVSYDEYGQTVGKSTDVISPTRRQGMEREKREASFENIQT